MSTFFAKNLWNGLICGFGNCIAEKGTGFPEAVYLFNETLLDGLNGLLHLNWKGAIGMRNGVFYNIKHKCPQVELGMREMRTASSQFIIHNTTQL